MSSATPASDAPEPIDIFIPYWGSPEYMREAVESVRAQTDPSWRLIVVDDAYPGTEIADYLGAVADDRISFIRKPVNQGITENYRTCVELATRPLTVMLGCDDRLLPNYVQEMQRAHASYPDAAIIQPGVRVIDEHGSAAMPLADRVKDRLVKPRGGGHQVLSGESLAVNLLIGDWLYWPSLAFRTDKLKATPFRDGFPVTQDFALIMDMVFRGDQLVASPTVAFEYRRHLQSASSVKLLDGSRFAGERAYFAAAAGIADSLGWRRAKRAAQARLTSRAHALALLPQALLAKDLGAVKALLRHGFAY